MFDYKFIEAHKIEALQQDVSAAAQAGWEWVSTAVTMAEGPNTKGGRSLIPLYVVTMRAPRSPAKGAPPSTGPVRGL
jgi:hypothetical protein